MRTMMMATMTIMTVTTNITTTAGYVYIPEVCRAANASCGLHVVLHGCAQYAGTIGTKFVENTGFNAWADANRFVVLYPQVGRGGGDGDDDEEEEEGEEEEEEEEGGEEEEEDDNGGKHGDANDSDDDDGCDHDNGGGGGADVLPRLVLRRPCRTR
jgi:hypothetical protein